MESRQPTVEDDVQDRGACRQLPLLLLSAARKGEAFDTSTGRPVSMLRASKGMSWYAFACAYVDLKWPRVAATTRRTHAEALTAVTTVMFTSTRGQPTASFSAPP
jgi:hypothetical protein